MECIIDGSSLAVQVSCWPDVEVHERLHESDDVLILACDGVWDVLSSEAAVDTVRSILDAGEHNVALVAEELIDLALDQGKKYASIIHYYINLYHIINLLWLICFALV
jgi:serine/threonine protein phosphatase PrpC